MGSIDKACISGFLCRLCSEMHRIVIHIYGDQGQRLCLVEKINGYLPITISPTDPLPKTICTTCLRRVEQHYDLLMRLSRIKEEKFLRLNSYKKRPRVSSISSIENSEDEVYQSDDESRRRYQQLDTPPQRQISQGQQNSLSSSTVSAAPLLMSATPAGSLNRRSSATSANNDGNDEVNNDDASDDHSGASTSASALAAITQRINMVSDTNIGDYSSSSSTSSLNTHPLSTETGNSFGIVLQQHSD